MIGTVIRTLLVVIYKLVEVESKNITIMTDHTVENLRTGVTYEDIEADMYNYDFNDKWHSSQLNTGGDERWDVEKYRKDTLTQEVKMNNYVSYADKDYTNIRYKPNNNNKVGLYLNFTMYICL